VDPEEGFPVDLFLLTRLDTRNHIQVKIQYSLSASRELSRLTRGSQRRVDHRNSTHSGEQISLYSEFPRRFEENDARWSCRRLQYSQQGLPKEDFFQSEASTEKSSTKYVVWAFVELNIRTRYCFRRPNVHKGLSNCRKKLASYWPWASMVRRSRTMSIREHVFCESGWSVRDKDDREQLTRYSAFSRCVNG
jgi:hypothetical protein